MAINLQQQQYRVLDSGLAVWLQICLSNMLLINFKHGQWKIFFLKKTMWWWQTKKADLLKEWKVSLGLPVQENWLAEVQVTECERSTGENSGNHFKSIFSFRKDYTRMWLYSQVVKKDKRQVLTTVNSVLAVMQIGKCFKFCLKIQKRTMPILNPEI